MKIMGYHGLSKGEIEGKVRFPFYLAFDHSLAEVYADDGESVIAVQAECTNPLLLDTPEKAIAAWDTSGAGDVQGDFHPVQTAAFMAWATGQSHDAVLLLPDAFETELGYAEVAGRWGEPQAILLAGCKVTVGSAD